MALTKVIGDGVQGISNSSDATAITIDSSETVGIKNTAPGNYLDGELTVGDSTKDQYINVVTGTGNAAGICFQDTTGTSIISGLRYTHLDNALGIWTNGSQRATIDSTGALTLPYQPAFLVRCGSGDNNNIPINAGTTISFTTEVFDQNLDFDLSNNLFTAPVTGKYQLNMSMTMGGGDTSTDYIQIEIQASNRSFYWIIDPDIADQDLTYFSATTVGLMDMDANDTAKIVVYMNNSGSAQMDTLNYCYFSGHLVA